MHYCTSFKEQDKIEHFRCCLRLRKKFSRIFFPSMWFLFFLASIAFFFLSPTTKTIPITSAIIDDTIQSNWNSLYDELIAWNYQYGDELSSTITTAWENALAAAQRYGSYVNALNSIGADIDAANGSGTNYVVGETTYDNSSSNEEMIHAIIKEMYANITWIIGCIGFYKFLPYYVRFKRRRWYRKILQRKKYAIRVLILASHLELYNSEGKPVIFIYKAQIKKGKRNLPKKHQMIGEIIEAKNGMYFVGSDIELVDVGPVLFVDKNDVPAEDYSKLREMLKGVFLEKYYDYSAE